MSQDKVSRRPESGVAVVGNAHGSIVRLIKSDRAVVDETAGKAEPSGINEELKNRSTRYNMYANGFCELMVAKKYVILLRRKRVPDCRQMHKDYKLYIPIFLQLAH